MAFNRTSEQEVRVEEACQAFEAAQRAALTPSRYFINKCSSEVGIEPLYAVKEAVAPRERPIRKLIKRLFR
jgi:hypothetical protein